MEITKKIEQYIPMVNFIAQIVGENCEVVLHNVTNPDHSIVAIVNNHISGRKVNGSLTDLAIEIIKKKLYKDRNYIDNYKAVTKNNKILRSASYFIKDDNGELIGMICVNVDVTDMVKARDVLDAMIMIDKDQNKVQPVEQNGLSLFENLDENIDEVILSLITSVLSEYEVVPERMSADEKMEVVKKLNDKGVFLFKGGVSEVAKYLKASETTIYRYLNKVK